MAASPTSLANVAQLPPTASTRTFTCSVSEARFEKVAAFYCFSLQVAAFCAALGRNFLRDYGSAYLGVALGHLG